MIRMLICNCPSGPTKAYKFLEPLVENWLDVPMYKGRQKCIDFLLKFSDYGPIPNEAINFIMKSGKFVIVVGWNDYKFRWADIGHGKVENSLDAEQIVREFA